MVYFQTKNSNFVNFWRAMEWKMLVHFIPIWDELWPWYNLRPFGNFVVIWHASPRFGVLHHENLATLSSGCQLAEIRAAGFSVVRASGALKDKRGQTFR
jgi:hypothetical protein